MNLIIHFKNIIFLFLILSKSIFSQEVQISFGTAIGGYKMNDLKDFNNTIQNDIPFQTKLVSNFPPFWNFQPSLCYKVKNLGFGISYIFESTGSRISSEDYSGEYYFDMRISSKTPTLFVKYNFSIFNQFNIGCYTRLGFIFTSLKTVEYLNVHDSILFNNKYKFGTQNESLEPGFIVNYQLFNFGIELNAGYLFQLGQSSFKNENAKSINPNIQMNKYTPNWKGYRVGIAIFYSFYLK